MIPLINLEAQYEQVREELESAVLAVLRGGRYILGPKVAELEERIAAYCGTEFSVGLNSGTDAIILALDALGIGHGDEVITSPFTFFATGESIARVGAKPVFVDIEPESMNIDPQKIAAAITPRTKAIMPVHIFGQPAEMEPILSLAREHGLKVIEDACQAIGAEYDGERVGSLADAGCFSFFPSKNLGGAGDGGILTTNDGRLAEKVEVLRRHGGKKKYFHEMLGYNSRLDEVQAAIIMVKLARLDGWNQKRRERAARYNELLADAQVKLPSRSTRSTHVYHLYVIRTPRRDAVIEALAAAGIASGAYYPLPLHLQEAFSDLGYTGGDLPAAEEAASQALAIPLCPFPDPEAQEEIAEVVRGVTG